MRSAVLFLVFNRPDYTRQVFEAIRAARPSRLYISADGPRANREGEPERCAEVRRIVTTVDWPCDVKTRFVDQNFGCKVSCANGVRWFFEHEEEGIIIEDDVLPMPSFFPYCDEMLERYRDDERVGMISGANLISSRFTTRNSYFFSRYPFFWGWGSWRRAWRHYDVTMEKWPGWRDNGGLLRLPDADRLFESHWQALFDATHRGEIDTWDYQWLFTCWQRGILTAVPAQNLILNFGFGRDATHTTGNTPIYVVNSKPQPLKFPLIHPTQVERHRAADALLGTEVFAINRLNYIRRQVRKRVPMLFSFARKIRAMLRRANRGVAQS